VGPDEVIRQHLVRLLNWGDAHMTLDEAVADFPADHMNATPPNIEYSPWHLLEHIRLAQRDILEFVRNPAYVSPPWPLGYWPGKNERTDEAGWNRTIELIREDIEAFRKMASDPAIDLYSAIPHGDGQTVLREILLVADHNCYHLAEFATLRQVMGTWPASR
jgi:hypothetical protein